jgi:predicted dehydrogenase
MVVEAWQKSPAEVMVGFNRRFSPLTQLVKQRVAVAGGPPVIQCRVNAGPIPTEHWSQSLEQGGGRIVGEMCHFVDLACYIAGAAPTQAQAFGLRNGKAPTLQDSLVATMTFANGAVASLTYVAEGDTAYPKELVEVFCGGQVMVIDDFRVCTVAARGKCDQTKLGHVDKGHAREMQEFVSLAAGKPSPILTFADCALSTAATLAIIESLTTGLPVDITAVAPSKT